MADLIHYVTVAAAPPVSVQSPVSFLCFLPIPFLITDWMYQNEYIYREKKIIMEGWGRCCITS